MDHSLTIIIPVYNEEENLLLLSDTLRSYLNIALIETKVLFINDGSTDKSQLIIESICDNDPSFNFILFSKNNGLSSALKAGFEEVKTSLVGYMDADLQTVPEDFNVLLEHIEDYELITGIRLNRKDGFGKLLSSKVANGFRRMITRDGIDDTGCPLKLLKSSYAKQIPMFSGLHRFLPAMILLQKGRIKQVPVQHFPRHAGTSKFGFWNRSLGPFADCFAYLWMKRRYIAYTITKTDL